MVGILSDCHSPTAYAYFCVDAHAVVRNLQADSLKWLHVTVESLWHIMIKTEEIFNTWKPQVHSFAQLVDSLYIVYHGTVSIL